MLKPGPEILEVPDELDAAEGRPLESYTPAELWRLAAGTYELMLAERTGGNGMALRRLSLEPYLERFITGLAPGATVLDLGSGNGLLVRRLREMGHLAEGVDIEPRDGGGAGAEIEPSDLEQFAARRSPRSVDAVILNLVLQWLPNLRRVTAGVAKVLRRGGLVLVTLQPPEFTKNGGWTKGDAARLISEPVRRPPFLTMLNESVGPLWYFPHTWPDILNAFAAEGLYVSGADYLFGDSFAAAGEDRAVLGRSFARTRMLPPFVAIVFFKP